MRSRIYSGFIVAGAAALALCSCSSPHGTNDSKMVPSTSSVRQVSLPTSTPKRTDAKRSIVLGRSLPKPYQPIGYGTARPSTIFNGGGIAISGRVVGVVWRSWGGNTAVASAIGWWVPKGAKGISEGKAAAVTVVASDPGMCHGRRAYRRLLIFFPNHNQTAASSAPLDICDW